MRRTKRTHVTTDRHQRVLKERDEFKEKLEKLNDCNSELTDRLSELEKQYDHMLAAQRLTEIENHNLKQQIGELVYVEPVGPRDGKVDYGRHGFALHSGGIRGCGYPARPGETILVKIRVRTINSENNEFSTISGDIINIHRREAPGGMNINTCTKSPQKGLTYEEAEKEAAGIRGYNPGKLPMIRPVLTGTPVR